MRRAPHSFAKKPIERDGGLNSDDVRLLVLSWLHNRSVYCYCCFSCGRPARGFGRLSLHCSHASAGSGAAGADSVALADAVEFLPKSGGKSSTMMTRRRRDFIPPISSSSLEVMTLCLSAAEIFSSPWAGMRPVLTAARNFASTASHTTAHCSACSRMFNGSSAESGIKCPRSVDRALRLAIASALPLHG